ncbi:hypothetical protein L9F63_025874, partial [Diploptera punctata]
TASSPVDVVTIPRNITRRPNLSPLNVKMSFKADLYYLDDQLYFIYFTFQITYLWIGRASPQDMLVHVFRAT